MHINYSCRPEVEQGDWLYISVFCALRLGKLNIGTKLELLRNLYVTRITCLRFCPSFIQEEPWKATDIQSENTIFCLPNAILSLSSVDLKKLTVCCSRLSSSLYYFKMPFITYIILFYKTSGYRHKSKNWTLWLVVRKRTLPTEWPPVVVEASANICG